MSILKRDVAETILQRALQHIGSPRPQVSVLNGISIALLGMATMACSNYKIEAAVISADLGVSRSATSVLCDCAFRPGDDMLMSTDSSSDGSGTYTVISDGGEVIGESIDVNVLSSTNLSVAGLTSSSYANGESFIIVAELSSSTGELYGYGIVARMLASPYVAFFDIYGVGENETITTTRAAKLKGELLAWSISTSNGTARAVLSGSPTAPSPAATSTPATSTFPYMQMFDHLGDYSTPVGYYTVLTAVPTTDPTVIAIRTSHPVPTVIPVLPASTAINACRYNCAMSYYATVVAIHAPSFPIPPTPNPTDAGCEWICGALGPGSPKCAVCLELLFYHYVRMRLHARADSVKCELRCLPTETPVPICTTVANTPTPGPTETPLPCPPGVAADICRCIMAGHSQSSCEYIAANGCDIACSICEGVSSPSCTYCAIFKLIDWKARRDPCVFCQLERGLTCPTATATP